MEPLCPVGYRYIFTATMGYRMEFPQKLKIKFLYDPVIPLIYIYPMEMKSLSWGLPELNSPQHCIKQDMETFYVSNTV